MAFLFPKSFPFCIPPEEETKDIQVGSGTNYPIGMTLEHAMALYWKSKTFSSIISYSASVVVDNNGNPVSINANCSQNGQLGLASPLWPEKMSGMICKSNPDDYLSYFAGQSEADGVITSSIEQPIEKREGKVDIIFFNVLGGIIARNKAYYPKIDASSFLRFAGNNIYGVALTSIARDNTRTVVDALNIKINGAEYRADLFIYIALNEFVYTPDSASASFVISGLNDREAN
jgi:hypothetical protein